MLNSPRQFCINLWNVARVLHSPNGMHSHSKNTMFSMVKVVYSCRGSSIVICQIPLLSPSKKGTLCPLDSQLLSVFMEVDKTLFWFSLLTYESQCRSPDFCLSCALAQEHYTMDPGLGKLHLLPAFLSCEHMPNPPLVGGFSRIPPTMVGDSC